MGVETVDIEFRARLDDFKKSVESVPGITKKAARELTSAWTSEIKKAEKQGGDSIQAAAKEAEKLEKLAGAIGGTVGDGIRSIGTLAKGAGAGLSDVGVKLAAVGIAAGAIMLTVGAMVSLGTSAISTVRGIEESVEALGEQDSAVIRNAGSIRAANAALEASDTSYSRLALTLTGIVAPAIEEVGYAVVGSVELLISATEAVEDVNTGFETLTGGTDLLTVAMAALAAPLSVIALPLAPLAGLAYMVADAFGSLADIGREAADGLAEQAEETERLTKWTGRLNEEENEREKRMLQALGMIESDADARDRAAAAANREGKERAAAAERASQGSAAAAAAASKADQQAQKAARATQQLSDMVQAALFAEMSEQEKILEVQRRQLERIDELEQAGASHAVAEAARAVVRDAAIRDTMELQKAADEAQYASMAKALDGAIALGLQAPIMEQAFRDSASAVSLALDALGDELEGLGDRNASVAMATKEDWQAAQGDLVAASAGAANGMLAIMDVVSDAQNAHLSKDSAEYRKNRKRQFAAHKAAAIAEAAINTALAFTKTMSQYAYPINIVLGALTIAAGVGTIATIAAQKPQFYTGGMVSAAARAGQQADAVDATLHDGEGVLTRRGVASMGGPEAVRAANAGQGSGGATVVAVSMLDSRILGDVWAGSGPRGSGGLMARVDSRLHGGLPGRAPPRSR